MTATARNGRPISGRWPRSCSSSFLYVLTLAPTTAFWDASEYIAAARVIGIPHPPGNPLFVILAHTFGLLPLAESYAARINLFAATTSAGAAAFWFLVAERWLRSIVPVRWARYGAAMARRAGGRHVVDGVEPVGGEREGVHRLAALDRRRPVAGGPLGRRRARPAPGPLAGADRLRADAHRHQSPDGLPRASCPRASTCCGPTGGWW